jgi:hypothetical protein
MESNENSKIVAHKNHYQVFQISFSSQNRKLNIIRFSTEMFANVAPESKIVFRHFAAVCECPTANENCPCECVRKNCKFNNLLDGIKYIYSSTILFPKESKFIVKVYEKYVEPNLKPKLLMIGHINEIYKEYLNSYREPDLIDVDEDILPHVNAIRTRNKLTEIKPSNKFIIEIQGMNIDRKRKHM